MSLKSKFLWYLYFFIFALLVLKNTYFTFSIQSPIHNYYITLMAFDKILAVFYGLHIVGAMINIFSLIPLILYIERIRFGGEKFWGNGRGTMVKGMVTFGLG